MPTPGGRVFKTQSSHSFAPALAIEEAEAAATEAALAALLLADTPDLLEMAKHQVLVRQLTLRPEQLVQQVTAAQQWLQQRLQPQSIQKSVSLRWNYQQRLLETRLDLALELGNGAQAIVQHLHGHGYKHQRPATDLLPTLPWLAAALGQLQPGVAVQWWVIGLVEGVVVECG